MMLIVSRNAVFALQNDEPGEETVARISFAHGFEERRWVAIADNRDRRGMNVVNVVGTVGVCRLAQDATFAALFGQV